MSDVPMGPGRFEAADDRWYPPQPGPLPVTRVGDNEISFQEKPLTDPKRREFDLSCKR